MGRPTAEHADRFPKEYLSKKYDACASWGMRDWYRALNFRRWIRDQIVPSNNPQLHNSESVKRELVRKLIAEPLSCDTPSSGISLAPILDQTISEFFCCDVFCDQTDEGIKYSSIRHALETEDKTIGELIGRYADAESSELSVHDLIELRTFPAWKMHREIRRNDQQPLLDRYFISVDLKSSDEQLHGAFKSWLKEIRGKIGSPERIKITVETLAKWHEERYLGFIDVYLWSLVFGEVTAAKYGEIYGTNSSVSKTDPENIRRTALKNAIALLNLENVSALERLSKHFHSQKKRSPS